MNTRSRLLLVIPAVTVLFTLTSFAQTSCSDYARTWDSRCQYSSTWAGECSAPSSPSVCESPYGWGRVRPAVCSSNWGYSGCKDKCGQAKCNGYSDCSQRRDCDQRRDCWKDARCGKRENDSKDCWTSANCGKKESRCCPAAKCGHGGHSSMQGGRTSLYSENADLIKDMEQRHMIPAHYAENLTQRNEAAGRYTNSGYGQWRQDDLAELNRVLRDMRNGR